MPLKCAESASSLLPLICTVLGWGAHDNAVARLKERID
jgi:hypothetical protein